MSQSKAFKSLNFKSNSNTNLHIVNLFNNDIKKNSLNYKNDLQEFKLSKDNKLTETSKLSLKKKKSFNQIKLIYLNKHYDLYQYNDNLNQIKSLRENTDCTSYKNDLLNEDGGVIIKSNNCFNQKETIPNNSDKINLDKNIEFFLTPISKPENNEFEKKSEEKSLLTNEHIINNYISSNCNNILSSKNNLKNFNEENNNYLMKEENRLIFKEKFFNINDNKNNCDYKNPNQTHLKKNSMSKHSNKELIKIDTLKFRKNFLAILNNKKDLYKFLQSDNFPVISKNFEKEKNRLNRNFIMSASHKKKYSSLFNKSKVSSDEKISHLNKEDYDINLEEEVKNIEEEQKLIPRKCRTGQNSKKIIDNSTKLNSIYENKEPNINNLKIEAETLCHKNLNNKFESVKNKNLLFLTNINQENKDGIISDIQSFSNKILLTPKMKQENYLNNIESCFTDKIPERILFKLPNKITDDFNERNEIINIKGNEAYYPINEKIKVFQQLPSYKDILLKRKSSLSFENNKIISKQESTTYHQEKEDKSINEFSDLNNNREYQPITSNGNFEMDINKEKHANDSSEIYNFFQRNFSSKILTKSPKEKQENSIQKCKFKFEDIGYSNIIKKKDLKEKELNFIKNSLDNVIKKNVILNIDNFNNNSEDKRNNIKYKTLKYDNGEILHFKDFLNSNSLFKERVNESELKKDTYKNNYKKYNVLNNSVFKNSVNKSASNFFSKQKIFSFVKDDCSKNKEHINQLNIIEKFSQSLNVKKIKFVFEKACKNEKIPQIFNNKILTKTPFK